MVFAEEDVAAVVEVVLTEVDVLAVVEVVLTEVDVPAVVEVVVLAVVEVESTVVDAGTSPYTIVILFSPVLAFCSKIFQKVLESMLFVPLDTKLYGVEI